MGHKDTVVGKLMGSEIEPAERARLVALANAAPDLLADLTEIVKWRGLIVQNYPDMAGLIRSLDAAQEHIGNAQGWHKAKGE